MHRIEPVGPPERDLVPVTPVVRRDPERDLEDERERRRREARRERPAPPRPPEREGGIDVQA